MTSGESKSHPPKPGTSARSPPPSQARGAQSGELCIESNSYRPSRGTRKLFRERPFGWRWMQKRSLRLQDCLNSSDQIRILEWIIIPPTVDKEHWSAVDAAASSACKIAAALG